MNIHNAETSELTALQAKGAKWFCVAAYAHMGHERGDVLSWHKTLYAAQRTAHGEYRTIAEVADVLADAKQFDALMKEVA